jgi:RNase P/RNase MRP subunit p30
MVMTRENATANAVRTDLVFPSGNEKHLAEMALRLGTEHLIFCYELKDPLLKMRAKEVELLKQEHLTTGFAIIVDSQQDVAKAKNFTKTIVGTARPELFEDKRVSHIIDMESGRRDDFIHHRNSGLNQVFLQHVNNNDKTLLVDASQLFSGQIAQGVVLGRIMQNNEFYRKYAPRVIVISGACEPLQMRAWRDLQVLLDL